MLPLAVLSCTAFRICDFARRMKPLPVGEVLAAWIESAVYNMHFT